MRGHHLIFESRVIWRGKGFLPCWEVLTQCSLDLYIAKRARCAWTDGRIFDSDLTGEYFRGPIWAGGVLVACSTPVKINSQCCTILRGLRRSLKVWSMYTHNLCLSSLNHNYIHFIRHKQPLAVTVFLFETWTKNIGGIQKVKAIKQIFILWCLIYMYISLKIERLNIKCYNRAWTILIKVKGGKINSNLHRS